MDQAALAKLNHILPQISEVPGYGKIPETEAVAAHQKAAVTSIRWNPNKTVSDKPELEPVPWNPSGVYLKERPVFTLDPLFHAGAYYVQEASSMFVEHAFKSVVETIETPIRVLDLCAAPGGKSTLLAALLKEDDLLISNEVIQTRASILAENLTRWGQMNTWVTNNDPKDFAKVPDYFDVMLVDAPCTGSGLWRKDEAALDEWSVDHVKLCSERQKRILADVMPALKPGGIVLYATCSYSAEENEMVADWICEHLDLEPVSIPVNDAWHITQTKSVKYNAPGYRFYPWKLNGEGFFLAAFKKRGEMEEAEEPSSSKKNKKQQQKNNTSKTKDETHRWKPWLNNDFLALEKNEEWYGIHAHHKKDYDLLQASLRIKKTGTALGKFAGKDVIPDHELALSIHLSKDVQRVEVQRDDALLFMKKEEVLKDNPVKGWQLLTFDGLGLGWGKWLPNRMNNYFPKNWRIRMDIK
jgi:16S rRNA C967 or C1407 C5-methylase (RsmB/RsmF family)